MKRLIMAAGVASALTLAGCSGSSTTSTPTTTAAPGLTKAQLIEKADAICKETDAKQKAIAEPKSEADVADYLDKNLKLAKDQMVSIKALGNPTDDTAAYIVTLESQTKVLDALEKKIPDFKKDPSKIASDTEMETLSKASEKAAAAFGFKECGQSGSSSKTTTTTG